MSEAFPAWGNSNLPVRNALWDYYMELNGRNTMKTEKDMDPYKQMSAEQIKIQVEKLLKSE
ncbi:hypothetical protein [Lentilactobacillus laojiaonis]|uniref:P8 family protein n=1 Tax=Lentilactobacillus laojiaonis TaxID=2883998 RepID=UPI001D0B93A2|nr:hypothetical protein [Lentilactobacillus laojiaonis]UDM32739.1 hypothetical protein LHL71_00455 [Lentilactobacillus laojiaonis]